MQVEPLYAGRALALNHHEEGVPQSTDQTGSNVHLWSKSKPENTGIIHLSCQLPQQMNTQHQEAAARPGHPLSWGTNPQQPEMGASQVSDHPQENRGSPRRAQKLCAPPPQSLLYAAPPFGCMSSYPL